MKKREINQFNFFRTGSLQTNWDLKNTRKRQKEEHITILKKFKCQPEACQGGENTEWTEAYSSLPGKNGIGGHVWWIEVRLINLYFASIFSIREIVFFKLEGTYVVNN